MQAWMQKQALWVVVGVAGMVLVLGQVSMVTAQNAKPFGGLTTLAQATPAEPGAQPGNAPLRTFLLYAGAYQLLDNSGGSCTGQCAIGNPLTAACSCPSGYTPTPAARILTDAAGLDVNGQPTSCGSELFICVK